MNYMIKGFGFSNYRNFKDPAKFSSLGKINILIGKNNSGKSNIISFVQKNLYSAFTQSVALGNTLHAGVPKDLGVEDYPLNSKSAYCFFIPLNRNVCKSNVSSYFSDNAKTNNILIDIDKIFNQWPDRDGDNIWIQSSQVIREDSKSEYNITGYESTHDIIIPSEIDFTQYSSLLYYSNEKSPRFQRVNEGASKVILYTLMKLMEYDKIEKSIVSTLGAFRKVEASQEDYHYDGVGIIEKLRDLQSPSIENEEDAFVKMSSIKEFVRDVLGDSNIDIRVPANDDIIIVRHDGKSLPLEKLGTGIHEVIIIAVACTLAKKQILCIEEPEIHLHPELQRKLIRYLDKTDNQYFISTHSAHILDSVKDAKVFYVKSDEGYAYLDYIELSDQKFNACSDLGYRASDIMQSNCIIWVEGPSDRIYIKYWMDYVCPELVEGIDYTIMFYGGRLLSHVSNLAVDNDDFVSDLISLQSMNRKSAFVVDSDKDSKDKHLTKQKSRLKSEFEKNNSFFWVTDGREIENYLDEEVLQEAIKKVHSGSNVNHIGSGKFNNLLKYKNGESGVVVDANKVKVAKKYLELTSDFKESDIYKYDLKEKIYGLVDFIKKSNDYLVVKPSDSNVLDVDASFSIIGEGLEVRFSDDKRVI